MSRILLTAVVVTGAMSAAFGEPIEITIKPVVVKGTVQDVQTIVAGRPRAATVPNVRKKIDRKDNLERVLLLTPQGPLVVEMRLTVDGKPFRVWREALVDDVLKLADTNGDGVPTWKEALANKRLRAYNPYSTFRVLNGQRMAMKSASFDKNKDQKVDRYEARAFLAARTGGTAFAVGSASPYLRGGTTTKSAAWDLLDKNKDGAISPGEIADASKRLKSRDKDDNDAVTLGELSGVVANQAGVFAVDRLMVARNRGSSIAFVLGPTADFGAIKKALKQYADALKQKPAALKKDSPLLAQFIKVIDSNRDGKLDKDEIKTLNSLKPHIRLTCEFAKGKTPKVVVAGTAALLGPKDKVVQKMSDGASVLAVHGGSVRLQQATRRSGMMVVRVEGFGQRSFAQLDTDKNNVLTRKEVEAARNGRFQARQFDNWDVDSNGKVTKKEYAEFQKRRQDASAGRVRMNAQPIGNRLFTALDANGDNQLGIRELRGIAKRLKSLDKNGDGSVASNEVPGSVTVNFSLAKAAFGGVFFLNNGGQDLGPRPGPAKGPRWFRSMDRNGDGDLTEKEFLGTAEQFRKIDADKDGLIDADEAAALEKSRKTERK